MGEKKAFSGERCLTPNAPAKKERRETPCLDKGPGGTHAVDLPKEEVYWLHSPTGEISVIKPDKARSSQALKM